MKNMDPIVLWLLLQGTAFAILSVVMLVSAIS